MLQTEEKYSLTDQLRRSSRAVNAMIAQPWARRRYPAAFVDKVDEALGEAMETQAWLDHATDCGYLDRGQYRCSTTPGKRSARCSIAWSGAPMICRSTSRQ